ncbi:hypothetical protein ACJDU8_21365 [Clostridium sp. WILCCON 0269]|uniref:Spore coat protein n=1 Tax=Candidatus Clostridium eludens TaxID=3381663 RepID=A0ABW8SQZ1_9CLOT
MDNSNNPMEEKKENAENSYNLENPIHCPYHSMPYDQIIEDEYVYPNNNAIKSEYKGQHKKHRPKKPKKNKRKLMHRPFPYYHSMPIFLLIIPYDDYDNCCDDCYDDCY